jgi:hypothetical protein
VADRVYSQAQGSGVVDEAAQGDLRLGMAKSADHSTCAEDGGRLENRACCVLQFRAFSLPEAARVRDVSSYAHKAASRGVRRLRVAELCKLLLCAYAADFAVPLPVSHPGGQCLAGLSGGHILIPPTDPQSERDEGQGRDAGHLGPFV